MVEGRPLPTGSNDPFDRATDVAENIARRNTQDSDGLARKPGVTRGIPLGSITHVVRHAIDLDHQSNLGAKEIEHIGTGRMLPSELEATGPRPQFAPQQALRQGQATTQPSCPFDRFPRARQHRDFPSTMLRMVPLPVPGRNRVRNGDNA